MRYLLKRASLALVAGMMVVSAVGCTMGAPTGGGGETTSAPPTQGETSSQPTAPVTDGDLKVGIAAREITNDYNRDIIDGAKVLFEGAGGEVTVTNAQGDSTKQIDDINSLINSGVNVLLIHLGDPTQLTPVVKKANEQGIVVVTAGVGSTIEGTIADVGGDENLMAVMASRALLESINYAGDIYAFWVPGAPLLETRIRILEAMVQDYPKVTLHKEPTEHSPAKVQSQMQTILTANSEKGSIAGVWGAYDQLSSGAVQAIEQAGRNEISVVAIDGDRATFSMLFTENGAFRATVVQNASLIGTLAAQAALDVRAGKPVGQALTSAWVATRNNGIEAANLRYGESLWEELGLDPTELAKTFPQDQEVVEVLPISPRR